MVACGCCSRWRRCRSPLDPDVYQGAPTPITAFFSIGPKAAAFAAFLRIFSTAFGTTAKEWSILLGLACVLTMVAGNLMAIVQDNVKRMLAYSSIGSAGFVLLGLLAQNDWGAVGVLYYLFAYLFAITGAFSVVLFLKGKEYGGERVDDFKASAASTLDRLRHAGLPPLAHRHARHRRVRGQVLPLRWRHQGGFILPARDRHPHERRLRVVLFPDHRQHVHRRRRTGN